MPNWRNELHGAPPGGLVSLHMTALVARVQGLGTRARRCRLWRHVVRRDSAVQEGLHEHTLDANHLEAGIPTPRDRRRLTRSWNDNDFIGLHCRLHRVPLHRDGYELQPLHLLHDIHPQQAPPTPRRPPTRRPYPATSHRLRVLRHPVAAVHLVRESVGVRAPSLCGFQHFPGERVTGNCTLSATSRPARNPHQVAAPFQSLQWNRPPVKRHLANYIPVQSCFQADEAAIRHTTRKTTTSTSE